MYSPFELGKPYDPERTNTRHIVLGFHGEDTRPELEMFRKTLDGIRERIIELLADNSAEWFGGHRKKAMAVEVVRANFTDLIKDGFSEKVNRQYPDNVTIKIQVRRGQIEASFFDDQARIIENTDELDTLGADVVAVANLSEIWFINNNFYPKFKLQQAMVYQGHVVDRTFGIVATESTPTSGGVADNNEDDGGAGWDGEEDVSGMSPTSLKRRWEDAGGDDGAVDEPEAKRANIGCIG